MARTSGPDETVSASLQNDLVPICSRKDTPKRPATIDPGVMARHFRQVKRPDPRGGPGRR